jgi:hypothetical protein
MTAGRSACCPCKYRLVTNPSWDHEHRRWAPQPPQPGMPLAGPYGPVAPYPPPQQPRGLGAGMWVAIIAIPTLLVLVAGAILVLVLARRAINPGPAYAEGDCVEVHWEYTTRVERSWVPKGKVGCDTTSTEPGTVHVVQVTAVVDSAAAQPFEHCKALEEAWFSDADTGTLYCGVIVFPRRE